MHCEEAEALLGRLVFDELEESDRAPLREHVESCAACRELAGDMRVAAKLLGEGIELETPVLSPERKEQLLRLGARSRLGAAAGKVLRGAWAVMTSHRVGAAAAALLVLVVGVVLSARVDDEGHIFGGKPAPGPARRKRPRRATDAIVPMELALPPADEEEGAAAARDGPEAKGKIPPRIVTLWRGKPGGGAAAAPESSAIDMDAPGFGSRDAGGKEDAARRALRSAVTKTRKGGVASRRSSTLDEEHVRGEFVARAGVEDAIERLRVLSEQQPRDAAARGAPPGDWYAWRGKASGATGGKKGIGFPEDPGNAFLDDDDNGLGLTDRDRIWSLPHTTTVGGRREHAQRGEVAGKRAAPARGAGEGGGPGGVLEFDPTNWSTPQRVVVAGVDGGAAPVDGDVQYKVVSADARAAKTHVHGVRPDESRTGTVVITGDNFTGAGDSLEDREWRHVGATVLGDGDVALSIDGVATTSRKGRPTPAKETPPPDDTLGPDMVAWWRLDETAGLTAADSVGADSGRLVNMDPATGRAAGKAARRTAADSAGNGNTGTLTNMAGTEWTSGKIGGAFDFDGVDDLVHSETDASVSVQLASVALDSAKPGRPPAGRTAAPEGAAPGTAGQAAVEARFIEPGKSFFEDIGVEFDKIPGTAGGGAGRLTAVRRRIGESPGTRAEAREALRRVVAKYPDSPAAKKAGEALSRLRFENRVQPFGLRLPPPPRVAAGAAPTGGPTAGGARTGVRRSVSRYGRRPAAEAPPPALRDELAEHWKLDDGAGRVAATAGRRREITKATPPPAPPLVVASRRRDLSGETTLGIYDIRDLTGQVPNFPGPELKMEVGKGEGTIARLIPEREEAEAKPTSGDIGRDITRKVTPGGWAPELGTSIEERGGKLVVMGGPEQHRAIEKYLKERRAKAAAGGAEEEKRRGRAGGRAVQIAKTPDRLARVAGKPEAKRPPRPFRTNGYAITEMEKFDRKGDARARRAAPKGVEIHTGVVPEPRDVDIFGEDQLHTIGAVTNYELKKKGDAKGPGRYAYDLPKTTTVGGDRERKPGDLPGAGTDLTFRTDTRRGTDKDREREATRKAAAAYKNVLARTKKLKGPGGRIAALEAAAETFKGTAYEKRIRSDIKRQRDSIMKARAKAASRRGRRSKGKGVGYLSADAATPAPAEPTPEPPARPGLPAGAPAIGTQTERGRVVDHEISGHAFEPIYEGRSLFGPRKAEKRPAGRSAEAAKAPARRPPVMGKGGRTAGQRRIVSKKAGPVAAGERYRTARQGRYTPGRSLEQFEPTQQGTVDGAIDDVVVYNGALSQDEIGDLLKTARARRGIRAEEAGERAGAQTGSVGGGGAGQRAGRMSRLARRGDLGKAVEAMKEAKEPGKPDPTVLGANVRAAKEFMDEDARRQGLAKAGKVLKERDEPDTTIFAMRVPERRTAEAAAKGRLKRTYDTALRRARSSLSRDPRGALRQIDEARRLARQLGRSTREADVLARTAREQAEYQTAFDQAKRYLQRGELARAKQSAQEGRRKKYTREVTSLLKAIDGKLAAKEGDTAASAGKWQDAAAAYERAAASGAAASGEGGGRDGEILEKLAAAKAKLADTKAGARAGLDRKLQAEAGAAKLAAVAKKAYEELDYAKALELSEKALKEHPDSPEAKELAAKTRALLGVRPDWARYGLEELSREKKVSIQQNLFRLESSLAEGRKLAERADKARPGDDERPAEERLSRRIGDLDRAIERFKRVGEITKWMPYRLDLTSREKETRKLLADAVKRRAEAAEQLRVERRRKATQAAVQRRNLETEVNHERLQQMMAMARIQHDRGKFEEAEEIASAIIKEDPTDKDAAALLALSRLKRHERAEAELHKRQVRGERKAWHVVEEAAIPYSDHVRYPADWERIRRRVETAGRVESRGEASEEARQEQTDRMHRTVLTQQGALQVAKGREEAAARHRIRMEEEFNRRRGGPSPRELAARKLLAGTQPERETAAPRARAEPGGDVDEIARNLDEAYGRITGQRAESDARALDKKAAAQRSRYLKEMGERLYGEMQYVRARDVLQRAVVLDPTNKEAAQRLEKVNDLLDVRMPSIRTSLGMLAREKQVTIQESLVGLENRLRRAAESIERSGKKPEGGEAGAGVTVWANKVRAADRAIRHAEQAKETIKWMPSEVDTAEQKRRADRLLVDAKNRRAQALAGLRKTKSQESRGRLQRVELEEQKLEEARIARLTDQVQMLLDNEEFERSEKLAERIMELDPANAKARELWGLSREQQYLKRELELRRSRKEEKLKIDERLAEAGIPYSEVLVYPADWKDISTREDAILREDIARLEKDLAHHKWIIGELKDSGVPVEDITGTRHVPSTEQGDRFFRGKDAKETLAERRARVEKELHDQSWQIQRLMEHGVPVRQILFAAEPQPAKPIHGTVLAVRPEVNLVMLSVGSDDNVKKGHRFTVYDGERYVGKVEVERPFSDMCSARILTGWTKEEIREGYDASTPLADAGGEAPSAPEPAARKDDRPPVPVARKDDGVPERSPRWIAARKLLGEDKGEDSSESADRERIRRRVETSGRIEKADEAEWEKDVRRKLDRKVSFEFADTPLSEALQFLQTLTGTPIDIDAKALKDGAGKAPITLKVTKMPLRTALKWVLRLADMDYTVRDDGVVVSTWELPPEKAQAEEAKRKEEARRKAEEERRRRIEAERKRKEEEKRRKEEEARRREEEAARLAAEETAPPPPVNPFVLTARDRFSTFALDTDTASYTIARNYIRRGSPPPPVRIRMEEFVNAFDYNYPTQAEDTFNIHAEGTAAPFGRGLYLLKIGVQAKVLGREGRKPAHLVFVVDTSGSMEKPDRLPLVKLALGMLLGELSGRDRVSLVTYGTQARLVLEAVAAAERKRIYDTIASLQCGGSTNLHEGVKLGYEIAKRHFRSGDINRVILCSDGVANVGSSVAGDILAKAEMFREWGVTLTTAGFGAGSYNDEMLEKLANSGDGNYVFIDSEREARRVFVEEMSATLQTVAKDAKIQVEFDPRTVRRYRLIGYENRAIKDKQFRDDTVDAGEVGSGQAATALYEIELVGRPVGRPRRRGDLGTVFVRYKNIDTGEVEEISKRLGRGLLARETVKGAPRLFLAACAAEFAEVLRGSEHARGATLGPVERLLVGVANELPLDGRIAELLRLVQRAKSLRGER